MRTDVRASETEHIFAIASTSNSRATRSRREPALGKLFSVEYNPNYSPTSSVCVPFIWIRNRMPMALASALRHGVYCPLVKERG